VECFGGWGKGEPGEARGGGGQHGWRGPAGGASTGGEGPSKVGGTGEEGPGGGKLDGCIMHQVHTNISEGLTPQIFSYKI